MASKSKQNPFKDIMSEIEGMIDQSLESSTDTGEIVDIMTFCYDEKFLDLHRANLDLYVGQRIILKSFYMGSRGNEDLKLTKEEWEWLYNNEEIEEIEDIEYENNIKDVIRKMVDLERNKDASAFTDLLLVLGRRAGKTLLASIITVYEAYKLLIINNGDPHGFYHLPADDTIAIINVALSQKQAGRLFEQISARIRNSPFFRSRVANETTSEIKLYTDSDLRKKELGHKMPGSILLLSGHSNPDSLAGYNSILILFDEIAFYDESGKITGSYFVERLTPSLSKFSKYGDGRTVLISSPNNRSGVFYENFVHSKTDDSILSFQMPTWKINEDVPYDADLLRKARVKNIERFAIEYGAQWSSTGTIGNYFDAELIDFAIKYDLLEHERPNPKMNYYLHVDPSSGNNNYSAVMVGKERYVSDRGQKRFRFVVAKCKVWRPKPGVGLIFREIDLEILQWCKKFNPIWVTYDDYHSMESLQFLKSHGIQCRKISFNRNTKMKIYQNLKDLLTYRPVPELLLYDNGGDSSLLIAEMKALKFKRTKRGFALVTDKHGVVDTDDLIDALAGACSSANDGVTAPLPEPVLAYTGYR